ncbi:MAG: phage portal protein [Gemmatimonadota bacterium]
MRILVRFGRWLQRIAGAAGDDFVSVEEARHAAAGRTKIGDGRGANVVMAPIQWIQRTFTLAEPVVQERDGRLWKPLPEHPAEERLSDPNPFYDGDTLMKAMVLSFCIDGNAYWRKIRSRLRGVVELWYIPHWLIEPKWPRDGSTFISHYEYTPLDGTKIDLDPDDVVHARNGLDPDNPRKGLSPIKAALREVLTDEEASAFSAYILHNMGVPGGVIAPEDAASAPDQGDVEELKEYMEKGFAGKNRGRWLVLGSPTKVQQFGFDPNRLMIGPLRDISEERICAALGVQPAVVGFGAGLQQTKVGATMRELVRLARVNCIEPTQDTIAKQLTRQLLPEFDPDPRRRRIRFDNASVPLFAEEETERAKRVGTLVSNGVLRVDHAQEMVGLEVDDSQAIYLRPTTHEAVRAGKAPEGGSGGGSEDGRDGDPPPPNRLRPAMHRNGRED